MSCFWNYKDKDIQMIKNILVVALLATCALAVQPRTKAHGFTAQAVMPDLSFKTLSLSDYQGQYVVLLFYPFDFTYVCPTEIISYSNKAADFRQINT